MAKGQCEYCRLPSQYHPGPFQIDHIIALQHAGSTTQENLALACIHCNRYKGPNIAGVDPLTQEIVRLFHPRRDPWTQHFARKGHLLEGLSPTGRATVAVLRMNDSDFAAVREALLEEGVFEE